MVCLYKGKLYVSFASGGSTQWAGLKGSRELRIAIAARLHTHLGRVGIVPPCRRDGAHRYRCEGLFGSEIVSILCAPPPPALCQLRRRPKLQRPRLAGGLSPPRSPRLSFAAFTLHFMSHLTASVCYGRGALQSSMRRLASLKLRCTARRHPARTCRLARP